MKQFVININIIITSFLILFPLFFSDVTDVT